MEVLIWGSLVYRVGKNTMHNIIYTFLHRRESLLLSYFHDKIMRMSLSRVKYYMKIVSSRVIIEACVTSLVLSIQ